MLFVTEMDTWMMEELGDDDKGGATVVKGVFCVEEMARSDSLAIIIVGARLGTKPTVVEFANSICTHYSPFYTVLLIVQWSQLMDISLFIHKLAVPSALE